MIEIAENAICQMQHVKQPMFCVFHKKMMWLIMYIYNGCPMHYTRHNRKLCIHWLCMGLACIWKYIHQKTSQNNLQLKIVKEPEFLQGGHKIQTFRIHETWTTRELFARAINNRQIKNVDTTDVIYRFIYEVCITVYIKNAY